MILAKSQKVIEAEKAGLLLERFSVLHGGFIDFCIISGMKYNKLVIDVQNNLVANLDEPRLKVSFASLFFISCSWLGKNFLLPRNGERVSQVTTRRRPQPLCFRYMKLCFAAVLTLRAPSLETLLY